VNRRLYWKLCLILATGVVALFYVIGILTSETEEGMSYLAINDREEITLWGKQAQSLYDAGDHQALTAWINTLQKQEQTWASVVSYQLDLVTGEKLMKRFYTGYNLGRSVDWKVHLYFADNPTMEVPFTNQQVSFLIQLPDRMRPGTYWRHTKITFQIILPTILLALLSYLLYRHILKPLLQLKMATNQFSKGNFDVRAKTLMGDRNDEFSDLASAFDQMAIRIGDQIVSQRQLIADLSHELRTPLTRLDIALETVKEKTDSAVNIDRINRESKLIRKLVEDTLTLAWLENEQPKLQQESLDLIDLLDVLVEDAQFEYPNHNIVCHFPNSVIIENSSHRAAGQAFENIIRNALRYTPVGKTVEISVFKKLNTIEVEVIDQGPGVPNEFLTTIFKPFFRVDKSRAANVSSFGLGLALAERQLAAIRAHVSANNIKNTGLKMLVTIPIK
jgi:two-component system sensor histidine kinase PfeS